VKFWKEYDDIVLDGKMLDRLQKRWQNWEQPRPVKSSFTKNDGAI